MALTTDLPLGNVLGANFAVAGLVKIGAALVLLLLLLAGGGFKAGYAHGATDDVGYRAVEKPVHVTDLFATLLHQLGLDHNRLTFRHHGRDETLTDSPVSGAKVMGDLIDGPVQA